MTYHQGRLIDHIHLCVADLERSRRFYRAVLDSIGLGDAFGAGDGCFYADELYVEQAGAGQMVSHVHVAFQARDRDSVRRFHRAALAAGGTDNGAPGLRAYHARYFAAFVLDPDGNNIEAVCDAPASRTADSVVVERHPPPASD